MVPEYWVGTSQANHLEFQSLSCVVNGQGTIYSFHGQLQAAGKTEERSVALTPLAQSPSPSERASFLFRSTYTTVLGVTSALITCRGPWQRNELNVNRLEQEQNLKRLLQYQILESFVTFYLCETFTSFFKTCPMIPAPGRQRRVHKNYPQWKK